MGEVLGLRRSRLTKQGNARGLVGAKHEALSNSTHLTHLWGVGLRGPHNATSALGWD